MEKVKKYFGILKRFFPQCRLYGFSVAFWSVVFPLHHVFGFLKPYLGAKKHGAIFRYLTDRYTGVLDGFTNKNTTSESAIQSESTIWVCWWDGEDAMPPLVKACYNSIKSHAGLHTVQFVSKYNFRDFISIPEYILKKLNAGIMTITHFSNIVRANLLYEYGGIWMDATILTLKDIAFDNMPFYTLKAPASKSSSVTLARYAGLSNPSASIHDGTNPQTSRWSGFLLAGTKHSIVFEYMRDILYAYWKDHDDQIDYVLYDYTIALGYEYIPAMKKLVDNVPCSDVEKFVMEKHLGFEFSEEQFSQFRQTQFHKLTWKINFSETAKDGSPTIYGYLLKHYNT